MPKSTKSAKKPHHKKSSSSSSSSSKDRRRASISEKLYSHKDFDFRFGIVGEFQFHKRTFSNVDLAQVCLKQLNMKAVILPNVNHATPHLIVVPDAFENVNDFENARQLVARGTVCYIPFTTFLSLLMHKTQISLLNGLGFTNSQSESYIRKLPEFCVSHDGLYFDGYVLPSDFIQEGLSSMGYKVKSAQKKLTQIGVATSNDHKRFGEILTELNIGDFLALQPHGEIPRLYKLIQDAFRTLPVATQQPQKQRKLKGNAENNVLQPIDVDEETSDSDNSGDDDEIPVQEEVQSETIKPIKNKSGKKIGQAITDRQILKNKKGKTIGKAVDYELDIMPDNEDSGDDAVEDQDDSKIQWVL